MAVFPRVRTYKGAERKVWIAKWKDRGGRWRQKEFARKKDAEHHEREMIREVGLGIHVPDRETRTFGQACEAWLKDNDRRWAIGDGMGGYTVYHYRAGARRYVLPELGGIPLTKLTRPILQELINRQSTEVTYSTLRRTLKVIRLVLKFAIDSGWLVRNPLVDKPLRLPDYEQEPVVPPTPDEVHRILAALAHKPHRWWISQYGNRRLMVMLALYAGLRRGEIISLHWEDLDLDNAWIAVRSTLTVYDGRKGPKTDAGVRRVPMAPELREELLRHAAARARAGRPLAGYVLTTDGARPYNPTQISGVEWPSVLQGDRPHREGLRAPAGDRRHAPPGGRLARPGDRGRPPGRAVDAARAPRRGPLGGAAGGGPGGSPWRASRRRSSPGGWP